CSEEPLVLALLPVDPGAGVVAGGEPAVDGTPQPGLAPQARGERELVEPDPVGAAKLTEGVQPVQLGEPVDAVAGRRAPRDDQAVLLEVAQHPRRPPRACGRGSDGQLLHDPNLITNV